MDLIRTERHLLKEMGFICHVEHPHKFISNYLATLGTPLELRQEAWNLANDRYFSGLVVHFTFGLDHCTLACDATWWLMSFMWLTLSLAYEFIGAFPNVEFSKVSCISFPFFFFGGGDL